MTTNIATFSQYGSAGSLPMNISTETALQSGTNKAANKWISSSVIVSLALSGTMGAINLIEPHAFSKPSINTYDIKIGFDVKATDRKLRELPLFFSESTHSLLSFISAEGLNALQQAILDTYGRVLIEATIHTDPEEGWSKPVFKVHSGIEDFDKLMAIEDSFFENAVKNPTLRETLPLVIISQA